MPRPCKRRFPWHLGAPSFVIPDTMAANVRYLAPRVDSIQLLFFESRSQSGLPHPIEMRELVTIAGEHNLIYTVHLPTDLRLGAAERRLRDTAIDEISYLFDLCAPLSAHSFDLHLQSEDDLPEERWLECCTASLDALSKRLGKNATAFLAVENIDYPFTRILPLIHASALSACFDWGHAERHGDALPFDQAGFLGKIRHIHLHGVTSGKDHQPLGAACRQQVRALGETLKLADWKGPVTIEVYSAPFLRQSLEFLSEAWGALIVEGGD